MGGQVSADWDALIQVLSCWMSKTGSCFKKKKVLGGEQEHQPPLQVSTLWALQRQCFYLWGEWSFVAPGIYLELKDTLKHLSFLWFLQVWIWHATICSLRM